MKRIITCLLVLALALFSVSAFAYEELPEIQFPIDTDVTISIWMPISSSCTNRISSYAENESFIYAQEATGIKVSFMHPSNSAVTEEFNLMITGGDLPDIIVNGRYQTGSANATQCVNGVEDGIYLDLTDYMPEYSPTYWNYLHTNEEFYQDATTPEGRVYYYTNYKNVTSDVEGSWDRFQVRKDWLEEVGLDTLYTVEDYEKYFQNILDNHPGITPFTMVPNGIERNFLTAFEVFDGWYHVGNEVKWGQVEDGYGEYLKLMNSWYQKGYISKDFTTISSERAQYLAGESGGYNGTSVDTFELCTPLGIPFQNCPYMRQYPDQEIHFPYYLRPANGQYSVVTAESEHIAEAMMFIDYGYQVEGSYTYCYGRPGLAWEYGEDGLPKYTDYIFNNPQGYDLTEASYIIRFHEGFPHMRDSDAYSIPSNTLYPDCLSYRLQWQDDPHCSTIDWTLPSLSLPNEDSVRRTEIMTDIDTYKNEMTLKYIVGDEPIDSYPAYQQHIWDLGLQEAIDLTQKAYDTLLAKKLPD